MLNISLVGCGTIGTEIAQAINNDFKDQSRLIAVCDKNPQQAEKLSSTLKQKPQIISLDQLDELINKSQLVIEAASGNIVPELVEKCLRADVDVMAISIGGFIGNPALFELAEKSRARLFLPSGALCGLDAVKAAKTSEIKKASLITRKPPKGLKGAPYLKNKGIDVAGLSAETVVFEGSAREAIEAFPKNINVSALLSIAGIGADKTKVKIITSPEFKTNSHQMIIEGDFGKIESLSENKPSPSNPKTSYLAVLSCIACLKQILSHVKLGT
jgi:aspartate dehydrogenase